MRKILLFLATALPWAAGISLIIIGQFELGLIVWVVLFGLGLWYRKKFTLMDGASAVIFGIIGFFTFILKDIRFYPLTGTIVYSVLFMTAVLSMILKKPLRASKAGAAAPARGFSLIKSCYWAAIFLICDALSLALIPSFWYVLAPGLVVLLGFVADKVIIRRIVR